MCIYYYSQDAPSFTQYNAIISFIGGSLTVVWNNLGMGPLVKGLQGPNNSIMQLNSVVTIALGALVLGVLPNV